MSEWWNPIDVTAWEPYATESRGPRRPKLWVKDPEGGIWLRKMPPPPDPARPNTARRSEPAIEVLSLVLANRAGIATSIARMALWSGEAGVERGVVSLRFHEADEQHHPGSELLGLPDESGSSPASKAHRDEGRASATFECVRDKLHELEQMYRVDLCAPFARMLVVDAWLGNGDRHSGNWALITGPRGARLAPMYDPTACLGVELTDDRRELTEPSPDRVAKYVDRCPSGFGGGLADLRTGIPMAELMQKLAPWPPWRDAVSEMRPVLTIATQEVEETLTKIPDDWLSQARKRFATAILARRVTLLQYT